MLKVSTAIKVYCFMKVTNDSPGFKDKWLPFMSKHRQDYMKYMESRKYYQVAQQSLLNVVTSTKHRHHSIHRSAIWKCGQKLCASNMWICTNSSLARLSGSGHLCCYRHNKNILHMWCGNDFLLFYATYHCL